MRVTEDNHGAQTDALYPAGSSIKLPSEKTDSQRPEFIVTSSCESIQSGNVNTDVSSAVCCYRLCILSGQGGIQSVNDSGSAVCFSCAQDLHVASGCSNWKHLTGRQ